MPAAGMQSRTAACTTVGGAPPFCHKQQASWPACRLFEYFSSHTHLEHMVGIHWVGIGHRIGSSRGCCSGGRRHAAAAVVAVEHAARRRCVPQLLLKLFPLCVRLRAGKGADKRTGRSVGRISTHALMPTGMPIPQACQPATEPASQPPNITLQRAPDCPSPFSAPPCTLTARGAAVGSPDRS